MEVKYQRAII